MLIYRSRTYGRRELPALPAIEVVSAKTAAYTANIEDAGTLFTNRGAAGSVTVTLPAPTLASAGDRFVFKKVANQTLVVNGGAAASIRGAGGAGITLTNSTSNDYGAITLVSDGTEWLLTGITGTWALA